MSKRHFTDSSRTPLDAHLLQTAGETGLAQLYAAERLVADIHADVNDMWPEQDPPREWKGNIHKDVTVPLMLTWCRQVEMKLVSDGSEGFGSDLDASPYLAMKYGRGLSCPLDGHLLDEYGGGLTDRCLHMWAEHLGQTVLMETEDEGGIYTDDFKQFLGSVGLVVMPDPDGAVVEAALALFKAQKEYSPDEDDEENADADD